MQKTKLDQDIVPLSEVRNGIATYIKQIHETKRPLVITQRGKSAAVLIDVQEFYLSNGYSVEQRVGMGKKLY